MLDLGNQQAELTDPGQEAFLRVVYAHEILGRAEIGMDGLLLNVVTGGGKTAVIAALIAEGKTTKQTIDAGGFIQALIRTIPTILRHAKFNECTENKERGISHMLVLFAFIGLFIVTSIFFVAIYGLQIHGPYSQLNPVKWLANVSGVALIIGSFLLIKTRMNKPDQKSAYKDWLLLGLVFGLGVTGMGAQLTRFQPVSSNPGASHPGVSRVASCIGMGARDPTGLLPVPRLQQSHLESGDLRRAGRSPVLVPHLHPPVTPLATCEVRPGVGHVKRFCRGHHATVPQVALARRQTLLRGSRQDPICRLGLAVLCALHRPAQPRLPDIDAQGIGQGTCLVRGPDTGTGHGVSVGRLGSAISLAGVPRPTNGQSEAGECMF